ncbi:MAG: UbiD family decarboxylase, partial [Coriobacteriaceae bacterium]|nr:UbiD family decarboxylase [Coriobacteriaceae bacterium]
MPYQDLRAFLSCLEAEGQLVRYHRLVQPSPDIGCISQAVTGMGHFGPAVMLDNIAGYKGSRVVVGIHGSWANHALALGLHKEATIKEQFHAVCGRWGGYPGRVEYREDPLCQEVVVDHAINLYELLPLYRINRLDGG